MTSEPAELVIEPEEESSEEEPAVSGDARASWANQYELFLSCLGLSMALGNFWRLPIVISANGGAAFLVVYSVTSVLVGKPVYIMEFFLGQFSSQGSVAIWRCVPVGRGVGICMCYVSLLTSLYLVCWMAHTMLYTWLSIGDKLPWSSCSDDPDCFVPKPGTVPCRDLNHRLAVLYADANLSEGREISYGGRTFHAPAAYVDNLTDRCQYGTHTAAEEFYFKRILGLSDDIGTFGNFRVDILACVAICWALFYVVTSKGIQHIGKVVYVTSLVPYAGLFVLLFLGVVMPGGHIGILYMLNPDWRSLVDYTVWYEAVRQTCFSAGMSTGVIINVGSFNRFSEGFHMVAILVGVAEVVLGLLTGLVVFSALGHRAHELDAPIEELVRHGMSLYFVSFPEAITNLEIANIWSMVFFGAFFLVMLGCNCLLMESVLTPLSDEYPALRARRPQTAFVYSLAAFFATMPLAMQNGIYIAYLMDAYVRGLLVPVVALVEVFIIGIFYGVTQLALDFQFATGRLLSRFVDFSLRVVVPCSFAMQVVYGVLRKQPPLHFESYKYPFVGKAVGWGVAAFGLLQIPLFALWTLYGANFDFGTALRAKPTWGPDKPERFKKYLDFLQKRGVRSLLVTDTAGLHKASKAKGKKVPSRARRSRAFREATIRRMSVALGRTPNELRRMEVLLGRRKSTASSTEPEPELKAPPPSAPPLLQIEPLPPESPPAGAEGGMPAEQGSLWGHQPPPPELAGLKIGGSQPEPDIVDEHLKELSRRASKRYSIAPYQAPATGTSAPLRPSMRRVGPHAAKGRITISEPTTPGHPRKPGGFGRRRSTIHGPPVVGYSELLRRPSVKLTLLEPIGDEGPEKEEQVQKEIHRALKDFRRKSMAVLRRQSMLPPQGPYLTPLQPADGTRGSVFRRKSLEVLRRQSMLPPQGPYLTPLQPADGTRGSVFRRKSLEVLRRQSMLPPGPYLAPLQPADGTRGSVFRRKSLEVLRRQSMLPPQGPYLAPLQPADGTRGSISGGPGLPLNMAMPRRSVVSGLPRDFATQRRSIGPGFTSGVAPPRRSISGSVPGKGEQSIGSEQDGDEDEDSGEEESSNSDSRSDRAWR